MDPRERILGFIGTHGPRVPNQISKEIGVDNFFASAYLSELKERGKLKISHLKIGGGSPLYFLPGQEEKLTQYVHNLSEKEEKVYQLLKSRRVLKDIDLVPVFRSAIRGIKDFAHPFEVQEGQETQIYWRYFLVSVEEAKRLVSPSKPVPKTALPKPEPKPVVKLPVVPVEKDKNSTLSPLPKSSMSSSSKQLTKEIPSNFYSDLISYFNRNKIEIVEEKIIRKSSEIDFVVDVPSAVGKQRYFVKAKSKKRINDGDLSSVFVAGQTKRLPTLFLGKGELTKKADLMLREEFKGMGYVRV